MFAKGKRYRFKMIIKDKETSFSGVIESYEHPLIKLEDTSGPSSITLIGVDPITKGAASSQKLDVEPHFYAGQIINVTSTNFICAEEEH